LKNAAMSDAPIRLTLNINGPYPVGHEIGFHILKRQGPSGPRGGETMPDTLLPIPRIVARKPVPTTKPVGAKPKKPGVTIQSVDRAFEILEILARSSGALSLAELSARAGLNPSTCHHLVGTITRRGYITQDGESRRYSLGSKILELGEARAAQINLVDLAIPFLTQLNRKTGEAIHLVVVEGTELITVFKLGSQHAVKVDSSARRSEAAHATATGKAILAWLPETQIDEILGVKGMERFTPRTIGSRRALIEELRLVRRYGYAEDREEFEPGVYCIGAAIRSRKGAVIGSISVSLPMMRVCDESLAVSRQEVMWAAQEVTKAFGSALQPDDRGNATPIRVLGKTPKTQGRGNRGEGA
jgi:IclR family transcriptional regulator, acetate operon repressor